jgi:predicted nucleic acid-binding Zn ribbon protein
MPIYEYRRPDGTTFEIQQSFSDEPLSADPETGVPVQRVLHPPAVHFKGKGFYNTDYGTRNRQRETAAAADKSSSSDGSSSGESAAPSSANGAGEGKGGAGQASGGGEKGGGEKGGGEKGGGEKGGAEAKAKKPVPAKS